MFEFIFLLVFVATLLVTGMTMMTVFAAMVIAFIVMTLLGMIGVMLKLLPWILVIAFGVWFFRNFVYSPRQKY
ncbi:envelope stress response protein PspG [Vibrio aestuarianus]|uniref:Phage-shock protein n=1 Tax=Vibrio aestuarianus TaxID=28171 RepID=A0ABN8TXH7_9VIBR|nr:envelope stress response protein PspG [Vibrio aestuarianus]MDE1215313.1 envelope stress response protein PspG [Vibrio aestuarianus]MDE1217969.1 envelope stress response protein PspG [Vibrio aestuarianus]MDE1226522.1 envelope stress response protein PspG [Vibrio aestuarianus]MDE1257705.1 envelope stress response protein PspG [Vibrio aestuarianus]MDE1262399.1 envelope stress response protein PspG [Vibrio aestuarianus]